MYGWLMVVVACARTCTHIPTRIYPARTSNPHPQPCNRRVRMRQRRTATAAERCRAVPSPMSSRACLVAACPSPCLWPPPSAEESSCCSAGACVRGCMCVRGYVTVCVHVRVHVCVCSECASHPYKDRPLVPVGSVRSEIHVTRTRAPSKRYIRTRSNPLPHLTPARSRRHTAPDTNVSNISRPGGQRVVWVRVIDRMCVCVCLCIRIH